MHTKPTTINIDLLPTDPYLAALQATEQAAAPSTQNRDEEIKGLRRAKKRAFNRNSAAGFDKDHYEFHQRREWDEHDRNAEAIEELFS